MTMFMQRRFILLSVVLVLLVAGLLGARHLGAPLLDPALGFAAKVSCSGVFVGGETLEQVRAGFPDPRLRSIVRVRVDREAGATHASVPLLGRRTAHYRGSLGCTLEPLQGEMLALFPAPPPNPSSGATSLPWPQGEATSAAEPRVDRGRLEAVVDSAFAEIPGRPARRTHAVAIVHGGRLILERYAPGYSGDHRFNGWSMTKSVTSALAGILAADGLLELESTALRPEWVRPGDDRSRITLGHLMQMSSGLEFDESYAPTGGATAMLFNSADAAAVAATSPLSHEPGTRWHYSSATTNLISAHFRVLLGNDLPAYLTYPSKRLFEPLGMRSAVFEPDPSGTLVGSSFMYATARDWARFGLLFLHDGMWMGDRILPEGWVSYSRTPAPAAPLGQYGAQWWLNAGDPTDPARRTWPDLPRDIFWASGYQGQYVVVVPTHDLVVVRLGVTEADGVFDLGAFLQSVLTAVPPGHAEESTEASPQGRPGM
jgi:CubicO group peptidase (beta-lactamase class C family)